MNFYPGRSIFRQVALVGLMLWLSPVGASSTLCGALLGDAVTLHEVFGATSADSDVLLRFVDQIDHEVARLESRPTQLAEYLPQNGWRAKFAIANYARTQLHAVLTRYHQNRMLRVDPGLDPELATLAEDERQLLNHEIFTHRDELLHLVDVLINGSEAGGSVIVEFGTAPGQTLSDGQIDELFGMYATFARRQHWLVDVLNQNDSAGATRALTIRLTGPGVLAWMPFEPACTESSRSGGSARRIAARSTPATSRSRCTASPRGWTFLWIRERSTSKRSARRARGDNTSTPPIRRCAHATKRADSTW